MHVFFYHFLLSYIWYIIIFTSIQKNIFQRYYFLKLYFSSEREIIDCVINALRCTSSQSLLDRACVLDRSTSRAPELPPSPRRPDVIVAHVLPPFPFLEISRSTDVQTRARVTCIHIFFRDPRHSVRVSNGTVHNSRVSGGVGYLDIKVEPRSGTRP